MFPDLLKTPYFFHFFFFLINTNKLCGIYSFDYLPTSTLVLSLGSYDPQLWTLGTMRIIIPIIYLANLTGTYTLFHVTLLDVKPKGGGRVGARLLEERYLSGDDVT
uniref:Uncharacterized protein n=1 Tax=Cacopsylla melanoneura TaxID=428564 RepID=A0A8D8QFV1_9HEMI